MRRTLMICGAVLALALLAIWAAGGLVGLQHLVQSLQHAAQDRLAGAVRALRGGAPGAMAALLAVCFTYGVLHAAGPGHGKMLIGGYGVARRVPMLPLAGIALASSLAQAAMAVALVYAAVAVLGWTRGAVLGTAEDVMAPISHVLIGGLGLWLVWRGCKGLWSQRHGGHDHAHDAHVHGPDCGHAHGPTLAEVSGLAGWRDTLALIAGIAIRPCSGALFLLVLTWQIGIGAAGVAGAFAMALGTATVTVAVAAMAVWAREGAFAALPGGSVARAVPVLELVIGGIVTFVALSLLWQTV